MKFTNEANVICEILNGLSIPAYRNLLLRLRGSRKKFSVASGLQLVQAWILARKTPAATTSLLFCCFWLLVASPTPSYQHQSSDHCAVLRNWNVWEQCEAVSSVFVCAVCNVVRHINVLKENFWFSDQIVGLNHVQMKDGHRRFCEKQSVCVLLDGQNGCNWILSSKTNFLSSRTQFCTKSTTIAAQQNYKLNTSFSVCVVEVYLKVIAYEISLCKIAAAAA